MSTMDDGAVFSMVICADGVVQTVQFDADGKPVEPSQNCPECLTCCPAIGAMISGVCASNPSFALLDLQEDRLVASGTRVERRNMRPPLRGPPAAQFSLMQNIRDRSPTRHVGHALLPGVAT
ncbi:MAG: hypothetical protein R8G34_23290 [Paracoccaceae bacterium]|nr:hypothetical protein [Paracoccaceae bacterium]